MSWKPVNLLMDVQCMLVFIENQLTIDFCYLHVAQVHMFNYRHVPYIYITITNYMTRNRKELKRLSVQVSEFRTTFIQTSIGKIFKRLDHVSQ